VWACGGVDVYEVTHLGSRGRAQHTTHAHTKKKYPLPLVSLRTRKTDCKTYSRLVRDQRAGDPAKRVRSGGESEGGVPLQVGCPQTSRLPGRPLQAPGGSGETQGDDATGYEVLVARTCRVDERCESDNAKVSTVRRFTVALERKRDRHGTTEGGEQRELVGLCASLPSKILNCSSRSTSS